MGNKDRIFLIFWKVSQRTCFTLTFSLASNEPDKTNSHKNGFIPCITPIKTCSINEKIDSCLLPNDKQDRRELLYAARGHQLQELQTEIVQLREDIAKEKRLSNHRLLLAEGEFCLWVILCYSNFIGIVFCFF